MAATCRAWATSFAVACLGITLGACASIVEYDDSTPASSTQPWTVSAKPSAEHSVQNQSQGPQGSRSLRSEPDSPNATIADYIRDQHITETPIRRGDPGAPQVDVVFPGGWTVTDQQIPDYAYGALVYTGVEAQNLSYPPNIVAVLSRLEGNVDPTKLLEFAGGEIKNLLAFVPVFDEPATVSGHPAYRIAGGYEIDGVRATAAQETVVISGTGGPYILQLNATSNEREANILYNGLEAVVASVDILS